MTLRHHLLSTLFLAIALLILLLCPAYSRSQTVTRDLAYTTDAAGTQRGDLYEPAGAGPFPAIVYLHGGSWRSGNKGSFSRLAGDLAKQGYVGFSINYDLQPHSFPISWEEARAAVRFVRAHAAEYHVDPARVVIAGTSAGGELAALVALAPQGPAAGSTQTGAASGDASVAAAIILNGVFDLSSSVHVITRYLGGDCAKVQAACTDASPIQHVHAGAPPFFVGHGNNDHVVDYHEAAAFVAALQGAQVPVTPFIAEGGPHMYWTKKNYYQANLAAVASFLKSTLPQQ